MNGLMLMNGQQAFEQLPEEAAEVCLVGEIAWMCDEKPVESVAIHKVHRQADFLCISVAVEVSHHEGSRGRHLAPYVVFLFQCVAHLLVR